MEREENRKKERPELKKEKRWKNKKILKNRERKKNIIHLRKPIAGLANSRYFDDVNMGVVYHSVLQGPESVH